MVVKRTSDNPRTEHVVTEDLLLASRAAHGDEEAFETLYNRYSRQIYFHILGIMKNKADAEDLTQEVFLRIYSSIGTYSGRASLGRWMRRVATNICIDSMRKRTVPTVPWPIMVSKDGDEQQVDFPDNENNLPLEVLTVQGEQDTILRAIASLPAYYRDTVMFHDIMDCSGKEVAKLMSCPIGTVKSRLSRARNLLKGMMAADSNLVWQDSSFSFPRKAAAI